MSLPSQKSGIYVPGWLIVLAVGIAIGFGACLYSGCWCGGDCKCETHSHEEDDRPDIGPPALMQKP